MRKMLQSLGNPVSENGIQNEMTKAALYEEEGVWEEEEWTTTRSTFPGRNGGLKNSSALHAAPDNLVPISPDFRSQVTGNCKRHRRSSMGIWSCEEKSTRCSPRLFSEIPRQGLRCPESRGRHACVSCREVCRIPVRRVRRAQLQNCNRRVLAERFLARQTRLRKIPTRRPAKLLHKFDLVIGTAALPTS